MTFTEIHEDTSFHQEAAYGTLNWVAVRLCRNLGWVKNNKSKLERVGFPRPDPITKRYIKADVDAWIESRRQIETKGNDMTTTGENPGAF